MESVTTTTLKDISNFFRVDLVRDGVCNNWSGYGFGGAPGGGRNNEEAGICYGLSSGGVKLTGCGSGECKGYGEGLAHGGREIVSMKDCEDEEWLEMLKSKQSDDIGKINGYYVNSYSDAEIMDTRMCVGKNLYEKESEFPFITAFEVGIDFSLKNCFIVKNGNTFHTFYDIKAMNDFIERQKRIKK